MLGNLFKSKSRKKNKTELVVLIVPYIIENDERASAVSQAIVDQAELLDIQQFPRRGPKMPNASTPTVASPSASNP